MWKRLRPGLSVVISVLLVLLPARAQDGMWTAEYYVNPNLQGTPALTLSEATPSRNWGLGAPTIGLPADNFSVRWRRVQTVAAGTYALTVRADDGVRVYVDGVLTLDQWVPSPGNVYRATLSLTAGAHTFVVEYFEAGGSAFLDYELVLVGSVAVPGTTEATATITTASLNVRNIPNPFSGGIVTRVSLGEVVPIIGQNADGTWLQVNVFGTVGWVNAAYVTASNLPFVPVTDSSTQPTGPFPSATATVTNASVLNVRETPDPVDGRVLVRIRRDETYPILGKNADGSWLLLNVNGVNGWVRARFVTATTLQNVPTVGNSAQTVPVIATVTTGTLNVRTLPDAAAGLIVTRVTLGQSYAAVGRTADGGWVQLNVNGQPGWVNARFVQVAPDVQVLPVTG
jgi:uncharacterized protein YraI